MSEAEPFTSINQLVSTCKDLGAKVFIYVELHGQEHIVQANCPAVTLWGLRGLLAKIADERDKQIRKEGFRK